MIDFAKLSAPFDPKLVSWRVGQVTKKDPRKASALCYIDARDVMERLDAVCGPDGWEDSYAETPKGRVICTIRIRVEKGDDGNRAQAMQNGYGVKSDKWISKSDGAGDTAVEGEKGGISDAFKRASVKWGIGRYLYDIPVQYVAINEYKQIEKSEYAKLAAALPGSRVACADDDQPGATVPPPPPPPPPAINPVAAFWAKGKYTLPADNQGEWVERFVKACATAPDDKALDALIHQNQAMWDGALVNPKYEGRLKGAVDERRDFFANPPRVAAE